MITKSNRNRWAFLLVVFSLSVTYCYGMATTSNCELPEDETAVEYVETDESRLVIVNDAREYELVQHVLKSYRERRLDAKRINRTLEEEAAPRIAKRD